MKMTFQMLTVAAMLVVAQAANAHADATPLGKVTEMLQGMLTKGKAMKIEERVEFSKFSEYCDTTRRDTIKAIRIGGENIEQQTAAIGKALSDAEVLSEDIKDQHADNSKVEGELKSATAIRKKERADYTTTHKDFTESIEAITKAIKVIKSKSKDVAQSLLQIQLSSLIPSETKATITSFIALSDSVETEGPPKANAYESQTGGVVAILEKLKLKFEDQKTTLEKEEASMKANFELLKQSLTDTLSDGKDTVSDKTGAKAKRMEIAASTKGDLEVTKKEKVADEKKLSDLNTECDAKSQEYDKNQVTRADEIKALETAVGILGSDTVSGAAKKHKLTASLLDSAVSLAQLRSEGTNKRRTLVTFLERRANALGSKYLSLAAARALSDPMGKVKRMIKELIVKLMEEANSEADQKGYCDSELAANKATRDDKTNEVDELTASVEKLTAEFSTMKGDIKELSTEIADLRKSQNKATELRNEDKRINTETIAEAKGAQLAVERATQVLREFYAKAKEASLLQETNQDTSSDGDTLSEDMTETADAPYKGMQQSKGGIIGMLETILSDFSKLESSTSSAEDEAASQYDRFMNAATQDADVKGVEMSHLEKKAETTEETIRSQKKELKATQEELDAALAYYEKLRPDCVDTGASYQDRVEMRQAEIQSLQEALRSLSS